MLGWALNLGFAGGGAAAANREDVHVQHIPGTPEKLVISFRADDDGLAERELGDLSAVLIRFVAEHESGSGTYDITLVDEYGQDVLAGLGGSLTKGTTSASHLFRSIDSANRGGRNITVTGRHRFEFSGSANERGTFVLYYTGNWSPRWELAGLS